MTQDTPRNPRYQEAIRAIAILKQALADTRTQRSNQALEERAHLRRGVQEILEPCLTQRTIERIQHALIAHMMLSRGMRDPLVREAGLTNVLTKLSSTDIGLLLDAYGDEGQFNRTPQLEDALKHLFDKSHESLRLRHDRKREQQVAEAQQEGHPTILAELDETLGPALRHELEVHGIFTALELSYYTLEQVRAMTGLSDDRLGHVPAVLDGLDLAFAQ